MYNFDPIQIALVERNEKLLLIFENSKTGRAKKFDLSGTKFDDSLFEPFDNASYPIELYIDRLLFTLKPIKNGIYKGTLQYKKFVIFPYAWMSFKVKEKTIKTLIRDLIEYK